MAINGSMIQKPLSLRVVLGVYMVYGHRLSRGSLKRCVRAWCMCAEEVYDFNSLD
jgi:hypothetical protein